MPTETEMKEFFQSVIDNVATLSSQAARVEGLERRINELNERVNGLSQANDELNRKLVDTQHQLNQADEHLSHVQHELGNEKAVTANLREVLISRDTKVQELEQNNQTERDAHKVTLSERDDARRRGEELDHQVNSFRSELEATQRDRDEWKDKARGLETEVTELKSKLARVQSILQPLQAVSGDFSAAG